MAVNILGSDSTPPPVTKMSPISNKFEGIPQQQRYYISSFICSVGLCGTYISTFLSCQSFFFPALLRVTQSLHLVRGFCPNYLKKV